jgi:hypothetical protein
MPKIKDVKPHIYSSLKEFKSTTGVKKIYIWGSYSKNIDNPEYRVRDIDILSKTTFNSDDLVSIDNNIVTSSFSNEHLENQGYDPLAVWFSKKFLGISKNIDCWAISADKKLLHWGPIFINKQESEEMHVEAEAYANKLTGVERKKVNKSSEAIVTNWYNTYCSYVNQCFKDMPTGWYQTESIKIKDILTDAIKI